MKVKSAWHAGEKNDSLKLKESNNRAEGSNVRNSILSTLLMGPDKRSGPECAKTYLEVKKIGKKCSEI